MMEIKNYKGAPFGVQTARFDVSGVHPLMRLPGAYAEIPYDLRNRLGPGMYSESELGGFCPKAVEERASGPGWARQYEVERMATIPRLLHKDTWLERRELIRKLGPGSHNFTDFLQILNDKPTSVRGICETRQTRFGGGRLSNTPGPGTYGKKGIPQTTLDEKAQRSTSTKGMMGSVTQARGEITLGGCRLGPGTYNFRGVSDEILNKVTSIRGPYDLFSADRNKPIIAGHSAAPKIANLGPGQYDMQSSFDEWAKDGKKHKGKFGTLVQYPFPPCERIFNSVLAQFPKEQHFPGPGAYDPPIQGQWPKPHHRRQKNEGFLSSSVRVDRRALRTLTKNYNHVGVGRYNVRKYDDKRHINNHKSVFKSKIGMPTMVYQKVLGERLRGKEVPTMEKSCRVGPQGLPGEEKTRHMYPLNGRITT